MRGGRRLAERFRSGTRCRGVEDRAELVGTHAPGEQLRSEQLVDGLEEELVEPEPIHPNGRVGIVEQRLVTLPAHAVGRGAPGQ